MNPASTGLGGCQIFIIMQYLYWPKYVEVIFCYCSYTWAVQLIRGVLHLDILFIWSFSFIRVLLSIFWNLHGRWNCWSRRHGSGDKHNTWHTDTHGGLFEHVADICQLHLWGFFFSVEKQSCWSWVIVFKCWIIRWWIKGIIVCNYLTVKCLFATVFISQLWSGIMWNVWDASRIEDSEEHVL